MSQNTPYRENIQHYLRDTFRREIAFVECDENGVETPLSLVGATLKMEIRAKRTDIVAATISTANGRITFPTGAASGACVLQLNPADAGGIFHGVEYTYDLQITKADGFVFTAIYGDFLTIKDVTA